MNDFIVTVNNKKKEIALSDNSKLTLDGKKFNCELSILLDHNYLLKVNDKYYEIAAENISNEKYLVFLEGFQIETIVRSALHEKASKLIEQKASLHHAVEVKAPMPGMILKVKKNAGDHVDKGETLLILEAMKMENDLRAPLSGKLKKIFVNEGIAVEKGTVLFTIE